MKYITPALVVALSLLIKPVWAEAYFCEIIATAGMKYDITSQEWTSTQFKPDGNVIISEPDSESPWKEEAFLITRVGKTVPEGWCELPFVDGDLSCRGFSEFKFNKNTMRIMSFSKWGYLDGLG